MGECRRGCYSFHGKQDIGSEEGSRIMYVCSKVWFGDLLSPAMSYLSRAKLPVNECLWEVLYSQT